VLLRDHSAQFASRAMLSLRPHLASTPPNAASTLLQFPDSRHALLGYRQLVASGAAGNLEAQPREMYPITQLLPLFVATLSFFPC
jgi:hypothetical protein